MSVVTVDLSDLRAGLQAVLPHVAGEKDTPWLQRLRITPFGQNLEVSATDRWTAGLALVSVERSDGDLDVIDLTVEDVRQVLAVHSAPPKGEQGSLDIRVDSAGVTFTDVSGLGFEGRSLTVPRLQPDEKFPDIRKTFAGDRVLGGGGRTFPAGGVWIHPPLLHRFEVAARVYGDPLVVDTFPGAMRSLLLAVGDSFLGALVPMRLDDADGLAAADREARQAWRRRLPFAGDLPFGVLVDDLGQVLSTDTDTVTPKEQA